MTFSNNTVSMELIELKNLLADAVAIGGRRIQIETKQISPYISKSEAYRTYGRRMVDRWLKEGLIKVSKDGDSSHKIRINRIQIESIAAASNRVSFFQHKERCEQKV